MIKALKSTTIFFFGGFLYGIIEILYRGYTHISMGITGGFCFLLIGLLDEYESFRIPIILQMVISAAIITISEFFTGMIVNVWLDLGVWDYSSMPLDFKGQICLPFSVIWFFLSFFAIIADDLMRKYVFSERKKISLNFVKKADKNALDGGIKL